MWSVGRDMFVKGEMYIGEGLDWPSVEWLRIIMLMEDWIYL